MSSSERIWQFGEFYVITVPCKDERADNVPHRLAFAVMHEPTGVQVAVTSMPPVALRVCAQLDKQMKEVRKDPLGDEDDVPRGGFGGGFPGFG